METKLKIKITYLELKFAINKFFRKLWLLKIKTPWNKLWLRDDEFHSSLDMDGEAMMYMSDEEREKYVIDLVKRRNEAHERDLNW